MYVVLVNEVNNDLVQDAQIYGGFRTFEAASEFANKVKARADKKEIENDMVGEANFVVDVFDVGKARLRDAYQYVDMRIESVLQIG